MSSSPRSMMICASVKRAKEKSQRHIGFSLSLSLCLSLSLSCSFSSGAVLWSFFCKPSACQQPRGDNSQSDSEAHSRSNLEKENSSRPCVSNHPLRKVLSEDSRRLRISREPAIKDCTPREKFFHGVNFSEEIFGQRNRVDNLRPNGSLEALARRILSVRKSFCTTWYEKVSTWHEWSLHVTISNFNIKAPGQKHPEK